MDNQAESDSGEETRLLDSSVNVEAHSGSCIACDPHRALHRYIVLIFISFLTFGSYFVYDNPAALQDVMMSDLRITTDKFTLFYSVYSWPNVILCFFGGFLIDRVFGVRWGAIIFCGLVTVGQIVFSLGALVNTYWLMNVGRFIFGMGGESLGVAQNTYAVRWFHGRELNMVFGLQLSFSRVGSTVNMYTMRPLYDSLHKYLSAGYQCLGVTLFVAGAFCLLSLFCALIMFYFDRRAQRILHKDGVQTDAVGEQIRFSDIKDFNIKFWLLCAICISYYVTIFPFISLALVFFENKYELDALMANTINSLVYFISAVASPICGFFIDRVGRNVFWLITGIMVTFVSHGLLAFTFLNPLVPMVIMGFAYSILASALWPLVPHIIPKHQIATAYGIMQSVQNLGLAVVSIVDGIIVDKKGYFMLEMSLLVWLCVSLIAAIALYFYDSAYGGLLNMSASQRVLLAERHTKQIHDEPDRPEAVAS
jgi:MFS family permease